MFTFETLQDDVSEVGDSEQKQARDSGWKWLKVSNVQTMGIE